MLMAIRNKCGGAARLWFIAKSLDQDGSGKVGQAALFDHLAGLKVGGRKRRRWLRAALNLGLLTEKVYRNGERVYRLVSWGRGFGALGCNTVKIGRPAELQTSGLVRPGWRALVWAAYEATLEGRIISQEQKHKLTGIEPRTQRNYLTSLEKVKRIQNYAKTDILPEQVEGARDALDLHLFVNEKTKKVVQRLPNIIVVPSNIARSLSKGRSRKAQSTVNAHTLGENSLFMQRVKNFSVRLFHENQKGANKAIKKLESEDQTGEVFWCKNTWVNSNQWGILSTGTQL